MNIQTKYMYAIKLKTSLLCCLARFSLRRSLDIVYINKSRLTTPILIKVDQHSVLNGCNHEDSDIK